jgi:hypothetical protein
MPSRWIRWEPSTHIYEYSTDFAASWNPLPLNAAILTEGVIDAARLPPTIPKLDTTNTFTGAPAIVISNPAASLRFTETDAPTDAKNWELQADGQIFKIRRANDAWSSFTDMILLHRAGVFQVFTDIATADHSFQCSANAKIGVNIRANNAGNASYSQLGLGNDVSVFATVMQMFSSTYNGSGEPDFPASMSIKSGGANGLSIVTTAGTRFYTGGSTSRRFEITASGDAKLSGSFYEKGRAVANGVYTNMPYVAGNFYGQGGTWTVEAADILQQNYSYVAGNLMHFNWDIRSTTIAGSNSWLYMTIPDGKTCAGRFAGSGMIGTTPCYLVTENGGNRIFLIPMAGGTVPVATNSASVIGSILICVN